MLLVFDGSRVVAVLPEGTCVPLALEIRPLTFADLARLHTTMRGAEASVHLATRTSGQFGRRKGAPVPFVNLDITLEAVQADSEPSCRVGSELDCGIYGSMYQGVLLISGKVAAFIKSDDYNGSPTVPRQVAQVCEDPTVELCYGELCSAQQDDIDATVCYRRPSPLEPGRFANRHWVPPHPTSFLRRVMFARLELFDLRDRIASSFELMARLIEVHRLRTVRIPDVLVETSAARRTRACPTSSSRTARSGKRRSSTSCNPRCRPSW